MHDGHLLRAGGGARRADRALDRAQAAELARAADVALLALTHLSPRYFAPAIEKEARAVFARTVVPRDFDVIEIPFPSGASRSWCDGRT